MVNYVLNLKGSSDILLFASFAQEKSISLDGQAVLLIHRYKVLYCQLCTQQPRNLDSK